MNFSFVNQDHQKKFQEIREAMPLYTRNNKEYLSVVFIMAGDEELYSKMAPYFDVQEGILSSVKMFEEQDFSTAFHVLARLAVHLFNHNETVEPLEFMSLDDQRMALAMNAILFRRYGLPSPYEEKEEKFYS
ncbi:DUF6075 family protein [Jeotgalibacillus terrae]|uniref:DUF6075 family protein n=1 Tax=Jeotgalibacillus terrae TaxID=587735 RepID=A0ABW5ZHW0_9BACL|nr:DUF6075 family protein [Jeotgalibacillus terrae]MBM7580817.1 hypothetical protein [Jeotgalibacillus terrae]